MSWSMTLSLVFSDDTARRRFRREARSLSQLNHPHVATVFDFGAEQGLDFIVMEYRPGATLADRLKRAEMSDVPLASALRASSSIRSAYRHSDAEEVGFGFNINPPGGIDQILGTPRSRHFALLWEVDDNRYLIAHSIRVHVSISHINSS
jgi:hypothetical protein